MATTDKWLVPGEIHITPTHHGVTKGTVAIAAVLILLWMMVGCTVFGVVTMVVH